MNGEYLELQTENFGSLFIRLQKETSHYYFVKQYPNLGLIPKIGILRLSRNKELLQLDKTKNYSDIGFRIISKTNNIPSKINKYRIYD